MWIIQPLQIQKDNQPTGRWRMTATSDEDGGGPYGDTSHDHASAEEAEACDRCDEYVSRISGFMSRKRTAQMSASQARPTGADIIEAVIRADAVQEAEKLPDGTFMFLWRPNAPEQIEAAIEEIEQETATPRWQPIATAPHDGNTFLAFVPHSQVGFAFVAVWNLDHRLLCMMSGRDYTNEATRWMPLPPLPTNG